MVKSQESKVQVTRWTPDGKERWAGLVSETAHANLAHAPEWFGAIQNAYGHTPVYLQVEGAGGQLAVLPAFLVRSRIFGTVVASMPFLDGGGPCGTASDLADIAVRSLIEEAARLGAGSVELRSTVKIDLPVPALEDKVNLVLPLPKHVGELWGRLDPKVRNQVRKAERSGLSVEFGHRETLDAFYDVFAVNMRDLGSPVHARAFFVTMLEAFGDGVRVGLVRKGPTAIGGLIAVAFKGGLVVPWASCLRQYLALCPNMLLYWETLAAACREGFARFDFGRSSRDSGTYRFKRQWGAEELPLYWYQIPIRRGGERSLSPTDSRGGSLVALWRCLPVAVTRWAGPRVRKYLTQ
jgi:FemAB-related protein (PEP-CTERM system-associated)